MLAAADQQGLHVAQQRIAGVDRGHRGTQAGHVLRTEHRLRAGDQFAAVGAGEQRAFGFLAGIAQGQAQQEAVELGIGQRIGARQVDRILGGDHEERIGQGMGAAVDGDLVLGHRLEQRALRARRCAVDLVGQQHVGEHRAGMEFEAPRLRVVHRHADDVRGQQVRGELHALEAQAEGRRQCMRQRGLAQPRQVLDQQVPVREQRHEGQPHFLRLAQHQGVDLGHGPGQRIAQHVG
jgi:hypothetical protein